MKKLLMLILTAAGLMAQVQTTLTYVAPLPVSSLGAAVVGTAGTTNACYWVVAHYVGGGILSAAPICLTNVPNTLSGSNYVQIGWNAVAGTSVTYDVLKNTTNTPPAAGASSSLTTGLTTTTYNDQGGSLSAYTVPAFPYATGSCLFLINNRDFLYPALEGLGTTGSPCQASFGVIAAKGTTGVIRLGSYTTPLTIDKTGALYLTSGSGVPGAAVGTVTAGGVFSVSASLTLAQVNAGTVILPAVTGQTYKISHFSLQAIGGAAATCTSVNIDDTTGTPVVAVAAAVAALTQNTRVTEATAAATVTTTAFAPTALTASQGIQVLSVGTACTGPTSFNVVVYFTINS